MSDKAVRRMGSTEWALLVTLSVFWGGSFFFVGVALAELPPFSVVAIRVAGAAAALLAVVGAFGYPIPRGKQVWAAFFMMGLLNNAIPFSLFAWGQTAISSGLASILNATTPLFGVVIAHFATADEKLTPARLGGAAIGFIGVTVMIGAGALEGNDSALLAQLACLLAAVVYAIAGVFGRRFRQLGVPPVVTAWGQVTASTALLVPMAIVVDKPWSLPLPGAETWAAVGGLALLSTALAYVLFFRILAVAGATNLLLVTFLIPVSAILLGVTILGERLEIRHLAGMALIGVGLALIDGRLLGRKRVRS